MAEGNISKSQSHTSGFEAIKRSSVLGQGAKRPPVAPQAQFFS
jgi:hypothetical protein